MMRRGVAGRIRVGLLGAWVVLAPAAVPAAEPAAAAPDPLFAEEFDLELEAGHVRDPIEPVNRGFFAVNRVLDRALIGPVADAYGWVVPGPVRRAVRRVFENLNEPGVMVNDLLQLEFRRAGEALGRFVLNSSFGFAGIFDPAVEAGFEAHYADFGQTLGKYGVGPGIYLVLPVLGPSTSRDALGNLVDMALRLDTWLLPFGPRLVLNGTYGISQRDLHGESLEALEQSSVDFYASIRSAYWMSREALVRDARSGSGAPRPAPAVEQALR